MTRKFAPHVERVRAISGSLSGRLFAYAGFRDTDAVTTSSVHVLSASKLTVQASVGVGSAIPRHLTAGDSPGGEREKPAPPKRGRRSGGRGRDRVGTGVAGGETGVAGVESGAAGGGAGVAGVESGAAPGESGSAGRVVR